MRVVIALGGNAILRRNQPLEASIQRKNIQTAVKSIAKIAKNHQVIITHGNGPQIGLLALMSTAYNDVSPYPLDALGAQTQGLIGYMLEQELRNYLPRHKVCAITTHTIIDVNDSAFSKPDKFIGPSYNTDQAKEVLKKNPLWVLEKDNMLYRRVVPSPQPQEILELDVLEHLFKLDDITVICAGGGGIPTARDNNGELYGIEAVIDKDRTSVLLAEHFKADCILLLTDIHAVETNFGNPNSKRINSATPDALEQFNFPEGSMAPKIESVCRFVRSGGQFAAIGSLKNAVEILNKTSGTIVEKHVSGDISYY